MTTDGGPQTDPAPSDSSTSDASAGSDGDAVSDSKAGALGLVWPDAPAGGFNASTTTTDMRRVPIYGLSSVNAQPAKDPGAEETADNRAIAYLPQSVDAATTYEVLVHFHGHNIGYRQTKGAASVRDLALDEIAVQIAASGRPMIALLPQGTPGSSFSPPTGRFDCDTFVTECMNALVSGGALAAVPPLGGRVISAHSGGGGFLLALEAASATPNLPSDQAALFLFDAINGVQSGATNEAPIHANFVVSKLEADFANIAAATDDDAKLAAAAAGFRFYGAYSQSMYQTWYAPFASAISAWFSSHAARLGGTDSAVYKALRANYRIDSVTGVSHDAMVGNGHVQTGLSMLA